MISIKKINSRQYLLNHNTYDRNAHKNYNSIRLMDESKNLFFESNAIEAIQNFQSLDEDSNSAYNKALDIFDMLWENSDSATMINKATDILSEGASKVRNASQLKNSLKYRIGKLKRTRNKRDETVEATKKMNNAVKSSIFNANSKKPKTPQGKPSTGVASESYMRLYEEACDIYECDRIVNNYATIHNRYNIDSLVTDFLEGNNDLYGTIYKITSYVDTFNTPFKNRYNSALETAWYGLNKRYIVCENSDIINAVTDYYIFNGGLSESEIDTINSISNSSPIYTKDDFSILSYLQNDVVPDETISVADFDFYGADYDSTSEINDLEESTLDKIVGLKLDKDPEFVYDKDVNELITSFKKQCVDNIDSSMNLISLKALIEKIISSHPEQIVFNLKNILSMIRSAFITNTDASILSSLVDSLVNAVLDLPIDKPKADNLINALSVENGYIISMIQRYKDGDVNTEEVSNLTKYKESLDSIISKIREFSNNNFESSNDDDKSYEFDEDNSTEGSYDDEDKNDGLVEAATIILISKLCESVTEDTIDGNVDQLIYGNIRKFSDDALDTVTQFAMVDPYVINRDRLKDELIKYQQSLRENDSIESYMKLDVVNSNISRLEHSTNLYNTYNDPKGIIAYLMCLNEIKHINPDNEDLYFSEAVSFTNSLKIAINNLKKKAVNLNEKQKQASNNLDAAISNIMKTMDKNISASDREAVAKGSILPSASKCIKLALTFGATWLINPTVAVVGALGAYFTKKNRTHKERQLALDEIEVELKMCERYMRVYEDKGDLEAVRQCEILQRNLQRQYQRIKYKMAVDFKHADTSKAAITTSTGKVYS